MALVTPNGTGIGFATPGFDLRQEGYSGLGELPLDPARYATFQGTQWAFALNAGKLRATYTYDTIASKVWAGATMTGAALIYNWPMTFNLALLQLIVQVRRNATITSAVGLGFGLGLANHATAPTKYAVRMSVRDGAATDQLRDTSDLQNNVVISTVTHRNGAVTRISTPGRHSFYSFDDPNVGTDVASTGSGRGPGYQDWTGATVYPALFFEGGVTSGTIDVDRVQHFFGRMG